MGVWWKKIFENKNPHTNQAKLPSGRNHPGSAGGALATLCNLQVGGRLLNRPVMTVSMRFRIRLAGEQFCPKYI